MRGARAAARVRINGQSARRRAPAATVATSRRIDRHLFVKKVAGLRVTLGDGAEAGAGDTAGLGQGAYPVGAPGQVVARAEQQDGIVAGVVVG